MRLQHLFRTVLFTALLVSTAGGCATPALIDELADTMQGRFDTHHATSNATPDSQQRLIDARQRIALPELGEHVFYLQLNQGEDLKLYRQRILSLQPGPKPGTVEQRAYTIVDAERFVDARRGDARFATLTASDLKPMFRTGCAQIWTKTERGFRGYVDPATCKIISSRTGKPRRIEAETIIEDGQMRLVERGYDDDMQQLFGTPQGSFTVLQRREEYKKPRHGAPSRESATTRQIELEEN